MIPTLLGMTFLVFMVMAMSPGGIGGSLLNELGQLDSQQARAQKDYYERRYGIRDNPLVQYGRWLHQVSPIGFEIDVNLDTGERRWNNFGFKWPDLGRSLAMKRQVTEIFAEALPVTVLLNVLTTPIIYALAILLGIYAARHRGRLFDVLSSVSLLALWSLPTIMVGTLLIGFLANRDYLPWFPPAGLSSLEAHNMAFLPGWSVDGWERGWLLDRLWHLTLPVVCLLYGSFAVLMKLMRTSVLENLSSDFIRTARAKGVTEHRVLWGHAFRNSLLPLITVMAGILPSLLGGSLIIEYIFSIPGMGQLMVEAIRARDREVVLANTLVIGLLGLLSILIADLLYAVADPRVSYE